MFLPDDYKAPNSSENYMKLLPGENKMRILSAPILGWEDWTKDKKPIRFKMADKPDIPIDATKPIKHFWAFLVWNYKDEMIQIFQITQAKIRKPLEALCKDEDWGAPYFYDIKIFKTGEGKETDYSVNPVPHKDTHPFIIAEYEKKPCLLEALFIGADPFACKDRCTPGVFSRDYVKPKSNVISLNSITVDQINEMNNLLYQDQNTDEALEILLKNCAVDKVDQISVERFKAAYDWLANRINTQKAVNEVPF